MATRQIQSAVRIDKPNRASYAARHPRHAAQAQGRPMPQQQPPARNIGPAPMQQQAPTMQPQQQPMQPPQMQFQPYPMPMQGQQLPPMQGGLQGGGFGAGFDGRQTSAQDFQSAPKPLQNPKFAGPGSSAMQQMQPQDQIGKMANDYAMSFQGK